MGLNLIITEKPSVAKSVSYAVNGSKSNRKDGYFEGPNYITTFVFGHMYELFSAKDYDPELAKWNLSNYPFFPKDFKYKPREDNGVKKQLRIIKELANNKEVNAIIIATDSDLEGQLIGSVLVRELNIDKPLKRLWINSHTPEEVRKGMSNLKDYSEIINLEKASYCRQHMDWIIGISYSVLTSVCYSSLNNYKVLPVGRVMLPTIKLIYDRNNEILKFKKEKYYELKAFIENSKGEQYIGYYIENNTTRFKDNNFIKQIRDNVDNKSGIILNKESKNTIENAPLLYNLTGLQGDISSKYNLSSDKVKKIAQELYERGYISYPRTSSRHLDDTQANEIERVLKIHSEDYPLDYRIIFKKDKRVFDSSKVDSHPALTPTYLIPENLTDEQTYVYGEIKKRFLSLFMPPNEYENTTIITLIDKYHFITKNKFLVKDGWAKLYKDYSQNKNIVPDLKINDIVKIIHVESLEKETEPPKHYTEKTLLKAMENCGKNVSEEEVEHILKGYSIGTPDTRSDTIKKILKIGYIEKKGKSLLITSLGKKLMEVFPVKELLDTDFTGRIQKSLKDIEKGIVNSEVFMDRMKSFVKKSATEFKIMELSSVKKDKAKTISLGKCPECGNEVIEGKRAYGCSNWKNGCKFSIWFNQLEKLGLKKISKTTAKQLLKGEKVSLRLISSKGNKPFECLGYLNKENGKWSIKFKFNSI